jgi:hypothetical protein
MHRRGPIPEQPKEYVPSSSNMLEDKILEEM